VVKPKGIEMNDFRLVAARQLRWDKDAWRDQGHLALVIRTLEQMVADETESAETRAEAEMLIRKLRVVGKRPALV
jgi:hypothetical protein